MMTRGNNFVGRVRAFAARDDGQSIIEAAVAAPFLILLLAGTFDLGRYAYDGIEIGNAARAGVQYAAQYGANNTVGIAGAAIADAGDLNLSITNVTSSTYCTCDSAQGVPLVSCATISSCAATDRVDTFAKVVVTKQFSPFFNVTGLPGSLTITKTATRQMSP